MKRIYFSLAAAMLMTPAALCAQDAAVEERLNKLSAQIEDLVVAKDAQNKRIEELARAVRELQDQQSRPNGSYASQEDLKRLAANLQEVERNRKEDNDRIVKELEKLGKTLRPAPVTSTRPPPSNPGPTTTSTPEAAPGSGKGFDYIIKEKDTLNAIAKAYNDQGIKVTVKQILDANPGLKPETMKINQKIFIPAPTP